MRIVRIKPERKTVPLPDDADDPTIWVHPTQPRLSLILGTNKARSPRGALGVFDLQGRMLQLIDNLDQPNNVDVGYGLLLQRRRVDIVVATERYAHRLRIFRVDAARRRLIDITDLSRARVFEGETDQRAMPMGIALYRPPKSTAIHAFVSRKAGPEKGYLHEYQLIETAPGKVGVRFVRAFGQFSGKQEIEAIGVDQELGYVYYADEGVGIRKYHADARHPDADKELALFASDFKGDHEGIAVYALPKGRGYLCCVEQLPNGSRLHLYARQGDQRQPLAIVELGTDSSDGIDVTSKSLGTPFEKGLLVAMHSEGRNFWLFRWDDILRALTNATR
jgi:3-phytase